MAISQHSFTSLFQTCPHLLPPPLFFSEGKIKDKGCWQFRATKTDVPIPKLITKSLQILLLHIQVSKKLTASSIFFEAIYIHNCITGSVLTTTQS